MNTRKKVAEQLKQKRKPRSLAEMLRLSFFIHEDGLLWLIHEGALPEPLEYMEYDGDDHKLYLVSKTGNVLDLGLPLTDAFREHLLQSKHVMAVNYTRMRVQDMTIVPVVVRKWDEENIED